MHHHIDAAINTKLYKIKGGISLSLSSFNEKLDKPVSMSEYVDF